MFEFFPRSLRQAWFWSLVLHAALLLGIAHTLPVRLAMPEARMSAVLKNDDVRSYPPVAAQPIARAASMEIAPLSPLRQLTENPTSRLPSPATLPAATPDTKGLPHSVALRQESASASSSPSVSADEIRQYRVSLAIAARRFKVYPDLARERGWEGTVEVAISLGALLPAPQVSLLGSSGRAVLDEQALAMVSQAARLTLIPESLKGRDFRVLLPVQFSLQD